MVSKRLRREVADRAGHVCEFCHFPEAADVVDFAVIDLITEIEFHVDHVRPRRHKGGNELGNLAWTCALCNIAKGYNLSGRDPTTGDYVPLFNPRTQNWKRHFKWIGAELRGRTKSGRATVETLAINDVDRMLARSELMQVGLNPDWS